MRILLVAALSACGAGEVEPTPTEDSGTPPTFTLPADLVVREDSSFTFDAEWRIAASEIYAGWDTVVSWDAKTADAWGVARAADSYGALVLLQLASSRADVMDRLADDDLDAVTVGRWSAPVAGETSAFLSDLQGFDPLTTLTEDDATSWLLLLADQAGARLDARDGLLLIPTTVLVGTSLSIPDGASETSWAARFGNDALRTDEGHTAYTVDFGGLSVDAYGKAFDPARVDEVFVGRFDDVNEADDLGGQVLDLQAAASAWWTLRSTGTSAALSDARDAGGTPFPGFTAGTGWLVGGRCTTCLGPAPTWLSVVEVRLP